MVCVVVRVFMQWIVVLTPPCFCCLCSESLPFLTPSFDCHLTTRHLLLLQVHASAHIYI